ncbi:aminoglycoside phosphotransferase family protein [Streptomyces sp. NPDC059957]|uniref:aminoglycoside phosphotransferase family protein n=1 Tax=unclassified Streptomyces TaxID=2593676 RepID=UPI0036625B9F
MPAGKMHADEPDIDSALVRRLIAGQFPQWAELPVARVDSAGTSNAMYRLGGDLVVRLPRTPGAAGDVGMEHVWLPRLAPDLPAAIPAPIGMGRPAEGYPWSWSVFGWVPGGNPVPGRIAEPDLLAKDLAEFISALHRADPAEAPASYRSETLADRDAETRAAIAELGASADADVPTGPVTALWEEALRAEPWPGPPVWIHADLQPGNLLLADGRLAAVIDFGCAGLGEPAVDLIPAWYVLPAAARPAFRAAARPAFRAALGADDAMWTRARGWALSIALMELNYYQATNPVMAAIARHVIGELLAPAPGPE